MLIDTTVTVGQNIRCFLNKKARGKVIGVDGFRLTVQWEDGKVVDVNRYNVIVMETGY
jgi:hypothetical protein